MEEAKLIFMYLAGYVVTFLTAIQVEINNSDYTRGEIIKTKWPTMVIGLILCPVTVIAYNEIASLHAYGVRLGNIILLVFFGLGFSYQAIISLLEWAKKKLFTKGKKVVNDKLK